MAKVIYKGEAFYFDLAAMPIHEGIALQRATGWRAKELAAALEAGDFIAFAALAWLILHHRMGKKDVTFEAICDGTYPVNLSDFQIEVDEQPGPTGGAAART